MLVFSKEQFLRSRYCDNRLTGGLIAVSIGWPDECEGLTPVECKALEFGVCNEWLVDMPDGMLQQLQEEIHRQLPLVSHERKKLRQDDFAAAFVRMLADIMGFVVSKSQVATLVAIIRQEVSNASKNISPTARS